MSNQIKLKRSNVAGNEPSASQLEVGEIALNMADAKLYFKDPSNVIKSISSGSGGGSGGGANVTTATSGTPSGGSSGDLWFLV